MCTNRWAELLSRVVLSACVLVRDGRQRPRSEKARPSAKRPVRKLRGGKSQDGGSTRPASGGHGGGSQWNGGYERRLQLLYHHRG